jgi:hypothetical protein
MLNKPSMPDADRGAHFMKGHLWSVVAASWAFAAGKAASTHFDGAILASGNLPGLLFQMILVTCSVFAIVLFVAMIVAFIPMLAIWLLAREFSISNVWYYVVAGALSGAALSLVTVFLRSGGFWGPPPDPTFLQTTTGFLLLMTPSGAIGGLVFWWVVGRFMRKAASVKATA